MYDVTVDRDKYIGGSDIPAIFGISPFKSRWQLLLEKAEPSKDRQSVVTSREIEYGNVMEPKIRAHINSNVSSIATFYPDQKIDGDLRANVDGWDGYGIILEIKTTSLIQKNVRNYKHYIIQLLFYMKVYGVEHGLLAVYRRPEDFNEEFDPHNLETHHIRLKDYEDWAEEIDYQLERFRVDLERVKENPLLTEQDLQPNEVIKAAQWVMSVEAQLEFFKNIEEEHKAAKIELKKAMEKHGIKRWITNNGTKITLVPDGEETVSKELDLKALEADLPELFKDVEDGGYMKSKVKKGRAGHVRITLPRKLG